MKIELRRAAMTYQAPDGEVAALRDVTFGVADGEFVSIVGPSGCGKSTLLALIAGIEHPSGGEVLVDGEPVRAPTGKAGLMPQRDQLFDWRTIWGNVTLGLEVRHENTPEHRGGVHDLLEQYQLAGFARKLPNQLSGGMRQRCALIRTLATSPDVLLLDEPFSALDYQTRLAVSGDISQIIRREHKTALLVTHDISEAISLSDRIIVLSHRPATVKAIHDLSPLAPLHNPAAILGIEASYKVFGEDKPNVAVFDTAFHSTMPPKAYMYAIPYEYYEKYGVRRYGFHGTSHKYVSHRAAEFLEEPIERLKLITCHLGNGSSIAAVDQGKVIDTSMGMTPLAGLMMGTRCGDLDPSVVNYLKYNLEITGHELDEILNKKSGLLGVSGVSSDKRDVEEAAMNGNKRAQLASDMLNYQIKKTIGSYIAAMGGVDAIVFTGGIGEHDADSRAKICHHMDWLGIRIDTDKNRDAHKQKKDVVEVTAWGARVRTLIIETNEELMIARDTKEVIEK